MKRCKPLWIVSILLLCLSLTACQGSNLDEPPVPMETVIQDSDGSYATFEVQLPKGWSFVPIVAAYTDMEVVADPALPPDFSEIEDDSEPYTIYIHYYQNRSAEEMGMYQELFAGQYEQFEKSLSESNQYWSDYFHIEEPLFECQYRHYRGTYGKITEVHLTSDETLGRKNYHEIRCYREDIPYVVIAVSYDGIDAGTIEAAPWIASSLKVEAHYHYEDGVIVLDEPSYSRIEE